MQRFLAQHNVNDPAQEPPYSLLRKSVAVYVQHQRELALTFPQVTALPPPPPAWASELIVTGTCFLGASLVAMADGSTRRIGTVRAGELVTGWPSAAAAAQRTPPTAMRVRAVQVYRLSGAPMVHGLQLQCAGGVLTLAPFFTANHPLLAADGAATWLAVDAAAATKEVRASPPLNEAAPAEVAPLLVGAHLRVAAAAAVPVPAAAASASAAEAGSTTQVRSLSRRRVTGAAMSGVPGEGAVLAVSTEPAGHGVVVYNLELDVPGHAVYIVNHLLCMD